MKCPQGLSGSLNRPTTAPCVRWLGMAPSVGLVQLVGQGQLGRLWAQAVLLGYLGSGA